MKAFTLLALAPLALAFAATKRQTPPDCALTCFAQQAANPGPCSPTDTQCQCTNPEMSAASRTCLQANCDEAGLAAAAAFAQQLCAEAGVTIPPDQIASFTATGGASPSASGGGASPTASPSGSGATPAPSGSQTQSHSGSHASPSPAQSSQVAASPSPTSGAMANGVAGSFVFVAGVGAAVVGLL